MKSQISSIDETLTRVLSTIASRAGVAGTHDSFAVEFSESDNAAFVDALSSGELCAFIDRHPEFELAKIDSTDAVPNNWEYYLERDRSLANLALHFRAPIRTHSEAVQLGVPVVAGVSKGAGQPVKLEKVVGLSARAEIAARIDFLRALKGKTRIGNRVFNKTVGFKSSSDRKAFVGKPLVEAIETAIKQSNLKRDDVESVVIYFGNESAHDAAKVIVKDGVFISTTKAALKSNSTSSTKHDNVTVVTSGHVPKPSY